MLMKAVEESQTYKSSASRANIASLIRFLVLGSTLKQAGHSGIVSARTVVEFERGISHYCFRQVLV